MHLQPFRKYELSEILSNALKIIITGAYFLFSTFDGTYDYAVILKYKHRLFPNRTQICIAGLGEWGTSGGSWFLSKNWKELSKKVGSKNFGAVIKVRC
jgi:hypothetical protein